MREKVTDKFLSFDCTLEEKQTGKVKRSSRETAGNDVWWLLRPQAMEELFEPVYNTIADETEAYRKR